MLGALAPKLKPVVVELAPNWKTGLFVSAVEVLPWSNDGKLNWGEGALLDELVKLKLDEVVRAGAVENNVCEVVAIGKDVFCGKELKTLDCG